MFSQLFISYLAFAEDSNLSVSTGYSFTTGQYNQSVDTTIEYIPVTTQYYTESWQLELTVPYIRVTGNGTVIPGVGGPMVHRDFNSGMLGSGGRSMGNNAASNTSTVTNSGLGDVILKLVYSFYSNVDNSIRYEMATNIKFATADDQKALGTGENDYALQLNGLFGTGGYVPYLSLGYSINGDSEQVTYQDVVYANAGLMITIDHKRSLGLSYDFQQAGVDGAEDFQQLNISMNWRYTKNGSVFLSGLTGLTTSSPDFGASLILSHNF